MYKSKYFKDHELLPDGYNDITVIDEKLLITIDQIRELIGLPLTVNADGRNWCGYRPPECTVGAKKSQHRLGKAADLHCASMSAEDMRVLLRKAIAEGGFEHIGGIEKDVSWLHVDVRPRIKGKVLWFNG